MPTKNPRINVTFDTETAGLLSELAIQKHISVSSLVRDMTMDALEQHEDFLFSQMADKLFKKGGKLYSSEDAWK